MLPRTLRATWGVAVVGTSLALGTLRDARAQGAPAAPSAGPSPAPSPSAMPSTTPSATPSTTPSATPSTSSPAGPSEEDRRVAERAYVAGEQLFAKGDFAKAARSFEDAHARVPHASSTWNAARSWYRAGELDRAANRYARYLAEASAGAPDRDEAARALRELTPRLGRFDVRAPGLADVRVDGEPSPLSMVYVYPGAHVLTAQAGERTVQRTESVGAGAVASVVLRDDPEAPAAGTAAPPPPASPLVTPVIVLTAPAAPPPPTTIWPLRGATLGLAVITVALSSVVIASGLDTLAARSDYDAAVQRGDVKAARSLFTDGVGKQQLTNALLGGMIGAAALTGAGVVWLVIAESPARGRGAATGALLGLRGDF